VKPSAACVAAVITFALSPGVRAGDSCELPTGDWAQRTGAIANDMAMDEEGSVYFTGDFDRQTDFDPTDGIDLRTSVGEPDIFLTKILTGGAYGWTVTIGGNDVDVGRRTVVDATDYVLIVGSFRGSVDFDPTEATDERAAVGDANAFLWMLSTDGAYLGTTVFGTGVGGSSAGAVAIDVDGNVVVAGLWDGTLDFDPSGSSDVHSSLLADADVFVTKFDRNGSYAWTRTFGATGFDRAGAVATDSHGAVVVTGTFRGTGDFDPMEGTDIHTATGVEDIFVTKLHADGSYGWTRTYPILYSPHRALAVDADGNVYLTCYFEGVTDLDPTEGVDWRYANDAADSFLKGDLFVTRLNADGSYGWTYTVGGPSQDIGRAVAVDQYGDILVTGHFRDTVDFDPGPGMDVHSSLSDTMFLTRLARDGTYKWTRSFEGLYSQGRYIITDRGSPVTLGGAFRATVDFDPGCAENELTVHHDGVANTFVTALACIEPSADADGNGFINLRDYAALQNCFTGPAPTVCTKGCEAFDFDHTDDIDLPDLTPFVDAVTGP